mmetsp:Transcript_45171/g.115569  ORF Transcript_45171/g.115569 Transcript_45171/m.115569 type:complete len:221 (-) Transcript_45171:79-741(-)
MGGMRSQQMGLPSSTHEIGQAGRMSGLLWHADGASRLPLLSSFVLSSEKSLQLIPKEVVKFGLSRVVSRSVHSRTAGSSPSSLSCTFDRAVLYRRTSFRARAASASTAAIAVERVPNSTADGLSRLPWGTSAARARKSAPHRSCPSWKSSRELPDTLAPARSEEAYSKRTAKCRHMPSYVPAYSDSMGAWHHQEGAPAHCANVSADSPAVSSGAKQRGEL